MERVLGGFVRVRIQKGAWMNSSDTQSRVRDLTNTPPFIGNCIHTTLIGRRLISIEARGAVAARSPSIKPAV